MINKRKVGIIGGGASGIMAAISAAKEGATVTIFEKKDCLGKKILATGNGRCNFSNLNMSYEYYYTDDEVFLKNTLDTFGVNELINFFNASGVLVKEKNGYLYPLSEQALTILDSLKLVLKNSNINTLLNTEICKINHINNGFVIVDSSQKEYFFDKVIISSGGRSGLAPKEYYNGYDLLKQLGIKYTRLYPALTQLKCEGLNFKNISGVRSDCKLTVLVDGVPTMEQCGEVLLNDTGLSGIVTFQISHHAIEELDKKNKVNIIIDFLPGIDEESLAGICKTKYLLNPEYSVSEFFDGFLNKKLNAEIIALSNLDPNLRISELSESSIINACMLMKQVNVSVKAGGDFSKSQVTGGGVSLSLINENFELKSIDGLFLTGEILNVDGICGGYNLQWAFSSGYIAGKASALEL